MTIGRQLALKFIERATLLDLRGKNRDDEAAAFFSGAGIALALVGREVEAKTVSAIAQLVVGIRGYAGVLMLAEEK